MTTPGHNGIAADQLRGFVERIERLEEEKKGIGEDIKLVYAELRAAGLVPKRVRDVIRRRREKPSDVQEAEALLDLYLSAMGMKMPEAPLFRHVGMLDVDITARESIIAALEPLVPEDGEIVLRVSGKSVRMWRDDAGAVHSEDVVNRPKPQAAPDAGPRRHRPEPPVCTEDEAEELGAKAAREDQPIIANPFAWNDARRPRWDEGWRRENGGDGMGPED